MHPFRLAYSTLFLIALVAFFLLWNEVGGSAHLDLMPWQLKLALVSAAALAFVKATEAAVSREQAWNGRTLRWGGILVSLLVAAGLATYYYHLYEEDVGDEEESVTEVRPVSAAARPFGAIGPSSKSETHCSLRLRLVQSSVLPSRDPREGCSATS